MKLMESMKLMKRKFRGSALNDFGTTASELAGNTQQRSNNASAPFYRIYARVLQLRQAHSRKR
jgi:hypothetical protein